MNILQFLLLSPLLVISATATLLLLLVAFFRRHALTAFFCFAGLNLALLATAVAAINAPDTVTEVLVVDHYSCYFTALMIIATLASCTFAASWLTQKTGQREELYILMLLSLAGGIVLVSAQHFAALFIGLEMLSIPMYGLIAYSLQHSRSLEAGIKYLVLSTTGSALMLFGIALIYAQFGSLSYAALGEQWAAMNNNYPALMLVGIMLVVIAFAFKLSLVPFHLWTPDVYEGAPAPVGAFLATTAKLAVAGALLRLVAQLPAFGHESLHAALSMVAGLSIIAGNLLAMLQTNIKRLLGYSSIAHFGYLMIAITALSPSLTPAAYMVYLFAYVLASLAAFGVITYLSAINCDAAAQDADSLYHYRGLYWRHPVLAIVMTIALLSLAGIPATIGFIGKLYVILAAIGSNLWWLLGTLVVGSAISLYYYLRVMVSLYLEPTTDIIPAPSGWGYLLSTTVLILLAALITLLGLFPDALFEIM